MKNILIIFVLFILTLTPFKSANYAFAVPDGYTGSVSSESQIIKSPNIFNKTWKEVMKTQKLLTIKISRTLKSIKNSNSPDILLFGLGISFLYGVVHALGPGHSKTIVASYFLSNKSKLLKPIIMAVQISFIHCFSAVAFVFLADVSLRSILVNPEGEIRIISLVSYAMIFLVGIYLIISKFRGKSDDCCCCKNTGMLALSAGLIPCTGALIVMLYALANQMIMVGIAFVIAISAGVAVTIAIVGVFSTLANKAVISGAGLIGDKTSKIITSVEYIGFTIIAIIGLIMFFATL